jgi:hypothetical protein
MTLEKDALNKTTAAGLARLLSDDPIGADWLPEDLGAILRHQLATRIDGSTITFGELLRNSAPSIALLEQVRTFAKGAMAHADSGLPYEVSGVIYYGAIAAALVRCAARITQLDNVSLRRGIQWALGQPWMGAELRGLFEQADDKLVV